MIQQTQQSNIVTDVESSNFSIEINESMFSMLTSKVYNNVIAAPIREWSTNAIDACIAASSPVKFDAHLPTLEELHFSIRDYGNGLSKKDLLGLFSTLGASTKRDSNDYNGTFGIGRMSGLAYATSFSVESWHNNKYLSYLISIQSGVPVAVLLAEEHSLEPSGLRLSLNVEPTDIHAFQQEAQKIYRFFDHKPNINIEMNLEIDTSEFISDDWFIDKNARSNYILMSNVAYRIDVSREIYDYDFHSLVIKAPTGAVSINPGRESLSFDKPTIEYINKRFKEIAEEYIELAEDAIEDQETRLDKLLTYSNLEKAAPYSIRQNLKVPSDPVINTFIGKKWSYCILKNSNPFNIRSYDSYNDRTKDINNQYYDIETLNRTKFIIIDANGNYYNKLKKVLPESCQLFVVSRQKGTTIKNFTPIAKKFLDDMGIDYYLASNYITEVEKTAPTTKEGIHICGAYSDGVSTNHQADPNIDYWYFPLKGSTPEVTNYEDLYKDHKLLKETAGIPPLVGVQKKYLQAVQESPNFKLAEPIIQSELDKHTFNIIDLKDLRESHPINVVCNMPTPIKDYLKQHEEFVKKRNTITYFRPEQAENDTYNIKTQILTHKTYWQDLLIKYPLFRSLFNDTHKKHYLELLYDQEQHKAHLNGGQIDNSST